MIIGLAYYLLHIFATMPGFQHFIEHLFRVDGVPGTAVLMLPLAYTTGTLLNALLHWIDLKKRYAHQNGGVGKAFFQSLVSALALGVVSYFVLNALAPIFGMRTFLGVLGQGTIAGFAGVLASVIVLTLFKNEEFFDLISALRQKFWKSNLIDPEKEPSKS